MTSEDDAGEEVEEQIEDLAAPAAAQEAVGGGADPCGNPSMICLGPTCNDTATWCLDYYKTHVVINAER